MISQAGDILTQKPFICSSRSNQIKALALWEVSRIISRICQLTISQMSHMQIKAFIVVHIDKFLYYHPEWYCDLVYREYLMDRDEILEGDSFWERSLRAIGIADTGNVLDPGLEEDKFLSCGHARLESGMGKDSLAWITCSQSGMITSKRLLRQ